MKNPALCVATALLALASGPSCSLLSSQEISYPVDAQELSQDVSKDFTVMGTLPMIDCTSSDAICTGMMPSGLPSSATIACEASATAGKKQCVLHYDLTVHVTVDLSKQVNFPSAVTDSPVINQVTIDEVRYWAGGGQKVNVDTPPLDIFIGDQTATMATDPGVQKLGTIASIPANATAPSAPPDCAKGPATSGDSACDLQLTDTGKSLFATLARNYKTPFNVILVGHLTIAGGISFPQGKMDLFLQPVIGFHL
jgi:hypothetical protein